MSISVMTLVTRYGPRDPALRFVLLMLADHANHEGGNCFPKAELLADETQYSVRQVQRICRRLREEGWISLEKPGTGRGVANRFVIHLERLTKGDKMSPFCSVKDDNVSPFRAGESAPEMTKRVTSGAEKGDICDIPPAPPNRSNRQEPSVIQKPKHATTPQAAFVLPDWVPQAPWEAWLEMRRKKRALPTPYATRLVVQKLDRLRRAGDPPGEVLDASTEAVWTGVFPLRREGGASQSRHGPSDAQFVACGPGMSEAEIREVRERLAAKEKQARGRA